MIYQCTIAKPTQFSGIGLHSGLRINTRLRPAESDNGIVFHQRTEEHTVSIRACADNVVDTRLATVLGKGEARISTVEHLLASLYAFGIDNLHIDIDGPEVPVMDGSAFPFAEILRKTGIKRLNSSKKYLAIRKPLTLIEGEKRLSIIPSRFFRVTSDIAFDHPCISLQHHTVKVTPDSFYKEIAPARTFGFLKEYEYLKANNLAKGGSLENAIVIGEDGILNPGGLRFSDEFVRHKTLDAVGDFSLLGYPIMGHIKAYKAGHQANHQMVTKILNSPEHWKLVEFTEEDLRAALQDRTPAYIANPLPSEA